jgi:hypothetical protein
MLLLPLRLRHSRVAASCTEYLLELVNLVMICHTLVDAQKTVNNADSGKEWNQSNYSSFSVFFLTCGFSVVFVLQSLVYQFLTSWEK